MNVLRDIWKTTWSAVPQSTKLVRVCKEDMMNGTHTSRWAQRGQRPARIANCSGAKMDPGYQMRRQAELGDVDFITGDYLAELNIAENAEAMAAGTHEGWEPTAWDGIQQSIDLLAQKHIKVIINGGALNPRGLAEKCQELIREKGYSEQLKVAYITGDDLLDEVKAQLETGKLPAHLDGTNPNVKLHELTAALKDVKGKPLVSANAYLGARGIMAALRHGADIIICGRVADASPVIAAAWYWHDWADTDYDGLAGALAAGHLIECSGYVTGGNFSGFDEYDLDTLVDLPFGIAEIDRDGTAVITKHENTNGIVTEEVVKCQFLYELQGAIYLNSDVKADTTNIRIESVGKDRVKLSGVKGHPPPPTTKLAICYRAGYQSQILVNATGYGTAKKFQLHEKQTRHFLARAGILDKLDVLEFQIVGTPAANPSSQLASTTYLRIVAQAAEASTLTAMAKAWSEPLMQHFSGFHLSWDMRTALPMPYLAFYPGLKLQDELEERAVLLFRDDNADDEATSSSKSSPTVSAGHPSRYEPLDDSRVSYDPSPTIPSQETPEPTTRIRLGDLALGRSGDKGANVNFGIFPRSKHQHPDPSKIQQQQRWAWLRRFMTRAKLQELVGSDWRPEYFIERMEFPGICAVHFVVYGILGRGCSSSTLLDNLGKGFTDYIRDKVVDVPVSIL